ncbi:MAG: NUDIX domain-containing protein [Nocardioidaceae bacterium]|nr:NUDIX domain-containing protein [Nocardioidaceae bacterium]
MTAEDAQWSTQFPTLFREGYVDYADCQISFTTTPAPEHLVSRLHLVAITSKGHVVVCRSEQGQRFLPGGTREPDETISALARRELLEEAGAHIRGAIRYFASHVATSHRGQPFRPHLPHPRTYWAYAIADVDLAEPPRNPPDGESIVEVLTLPPMEAADYIEPHDPLHAHVVRLALAMGRI